MVPLCLISSALVDIFKTTPPLFFKDTLDTLETQARLVFEALSLAKGITPYAAQGGYFMLVKIDCAKLKDIKDDMDFVGRQYPHQTHFILYI